MLTPAVRCAFAFVLAFSACLSPYGSAFAQTPPAAPSAPAPSAPVPSDPAPSAPVPSDPAPSAPVDAPLDPDAGVPDAVESPADAAVAEPEAIPAEPAPTTGVIEGTVTSLENGAPVAAAKVYVRGEPLEAETATDGRFTLTVPPGVHRLSVIHGFHETQTADVEAIAGQTVTITLELVPAQLEYDDFLVTAPRIKGTVAATLQERRESARVVDAISVADISRSPDGTASAATRRIVGATIVGGQYLYVRGLGGRYTTVRLNGVPLPSTDPDLPGFQLDLFPASLLSSLNIAKTFTPDIPGDFAGGSMDVVTRDFPDDFTLTISLGASTTTETVDNTSLTYDGGGTDFLGFDDGTRDLPSEIADRPLAIERRTTPGFSQEEAGRISGQFGPVSPLRERGWFPNTNFSLSVGDSTKIAGRRLGFLASLGYRYSLQTVNATARKLANVSDEASNIREIDSAEGTGTTERALIGLLGAASYELAENHDVRLVSMLTQSSEDFTFTGYTAALDSFNDLPVDRTMFRFIERQLFFNQLLAHHDFDAVVFDWQLNASTVQRNQPDSVDIFRVGEPRRVNFEADTTRFWSELDQFDYGGGADVTVPIDEAKLKAGYMGRAGDREFDARKFQPSELRGAEIDFELPASVILDPVNAGQTFRYDEITRTDDGFTGDEQLHAGYAMIDTPTFEWLRLTTGARIESSTQSIITGSRFRPNPMFEPEISRTTTDVLPSAALTVALSEDMSIRAAYGGTVARPVMRELAPVINTDFVRKRNVVGNPDLRRTYIHNLDLRWELFPSDVEVVAASVFYKAFQSPIESIVTRNGDFSFANIKGATNFGVELEGRIGLDRAISSLEGWSLSANLALIQSQVQLRPEEQLLATNDERAMTGQSPYVANLSLNYANDASPFGLNLFYNVFGRRIRDAGTEELPDTYEEAFHSVDASASYRLGRHFTLGASAQNLLFYPVRVTQGGFLIARAEEGMTVGISLGFKNQ